METTKSGIFPDKKTFADYVIKTYGGISWVRKTNKRHQDWGDDEFLTYVSSRVLELIERFHQVDLEYFAAAYGIWWSITSGRLGYRIVKDLGTMDTRKLLEFIYELSTKIEVVGQVPRFLIDRYLETHEI